MKQSNNIAFVLKKSFTGLDMKGCKLKYFEAIGYFTNLKSALREKKKHPGSFVFPFECSFHAASGKGRGLIRPTY